MLTVIAAGADHAAQVEIAGPVLGVGTTTPTIAIPAAACTICAVHHRIGAKQADPGFIADGNVEADLAAAIAEVGVAIASGTVATTAAKAAHPSIQPGLIHLVGEQQAMGLQNLPVAQSVHRDDHAICIGIGFDANGVERGHVVAIERPLEVRLCFNVIDLIAFEPERAEWFSGAWLGRGVRCGFKSGFLNQLLELPIRRSRRELSTGPKARRHDHHSFGLVWLVRLL